LATEESKETLWPQAVPKLQVCDRKETAKAYSSTKPRRGGIGFGCGAGACVPGYEFRQERHNLRLAATLAPQG